MKELERLYELRGEMEWYIEKWQDQIMEYQEKINHIDEKINKLRPKAIETTEPPRP